MRRLLALVIVAVAATIALPAPAGAGGPTSVLVTDPGSGLAAALYWSDSRYEELDELLADGEPLAQEPPGLGGSALNLTWMVHDVEPWRTQQLFTGAEGGPVVATYDDVLAGDDGVVWSRLADRAAVVALLDEVLQPGTTAPATTDAGATNDEPSVVEREVVRTETAWYSLTGWRWLLPGLLLGAGLAFVAARRRAPEDDPRQVLTDVQVGSAAGRPRKA